MQLSLGQVAESNLGELSEALRGASFCTAEARFYADALCRFFESDITGLERLLAELKQSSITLESNAALKLILAWRLDLKRRTGLSANDIHDKLEILNSPEFRESDCADKDVWLGELYFVLAESAYFASEFEISRRFFSAATSSYETAGMNRKALKCALNLIAVESCQNPLKRMFAQYHLVANKAEALGETQVAATAHCNISREFQTLGALQVALKHASLAIELVSVSDPGSRQYHLLLLQRAHVLYDLGRTIEASIDLEEALASQDPIVMDAAQVLTEKIKSPERSEADSTIPVWREVKDHVKSGVQYRPVGTLEAEAIRLLSAGPIPRIDLIEHLYGKHLDFAVKENRFKNLLNRIRKRYPGLVLYENGSYRLIDDAAPVWLKGEAR